MIDYILDLIGYKGWTICFFGVGALAFFVGFAGLRRKRMIENTPTSTIRGAAMGLAEIKGGARPIPYKGGKLIAPLSGKECAYFKFEIQVHVKKGRRYTWETLMTGDTSSHPFNICDETGVMAVFPREAEIELKPDFEHISWGKNLPPNLHSLLQQYKLEKYANRRLSFTEWNISEYQDLYVIGAVQKHNDADTGQADMPELKIAKSDGETMFMISDSSEKDIVGQLDFISKVGIFGGGALMICTFYSLAVFMKSFKP